MALPKHFYSDLELDPMLGHESTRATARSYYESSTYSPRWRANEMIRYLTAYRQAQKNGYQFDIPASEPDEVIKAFYRYEIFGKDFEDKRWLDYRTAADYDLDKTRFDASKIKSLIIAGADEEFIAMDVMGRSLYSTQLYLAHFFDAKQYLHIDNFVQSVVFNYVNQEKGYLTVPGESLVERAWLVVAYHRKVEGLLKFWKDKEKLNDREVQEMEQDIFHTIVKGARDFLVTERAEVPRRNSYTWDRYNQAVIMRTQNKQLEQSSGVGDMKEFINAFHVSIKDRTDLPADVFAALHMTETPAEISRVELISLPKPDRIKKIDRMNPFRIEEKAMQDEEHDVSFLDLDLR